MQKFTGLITTPFFKFIVELCKVDIKKSWGNEPHSKFKVGGSWVELKNQFKYNREWGYLEFKKENLKILIKLDYKNKI